MASIAGFKSEWFSESTFIEAHTSGSTGIPKKIYLHKSDMRASALATNKFFRIDSDSVLALPLSTDYIAGKMMVVRACLANCKIIELPTSNDISIPSEVDCIDLLPIVPTQIKSLLQQPSLSKKIRNVLIGGAPPTEDDCRQLVHAGYKAFISYGMTETCSHVALADAADPIRVFHAMPGITFDVDSDGRLIINAPSFTFGSLTTNDIVTLLSPTEMMWRGRYDNVINSGGLKLIPEELEAIYRPVLQGYRYYVTGVPDDKWGRAVALVIEAEEYEIERIAAALESAIDNHRFLPKQIKTVKKLPLTSNGKIKRNMM